MRRNALPLLFALLFLTPLSLLALWFDLQAAWDLTRQFQSSRYPSVPGTVTLSKVDTSRGSKGSTRYAFRLQYEYEVQGRKYEGKRLRYVSVRASTVPSTDRLARRFRQGSTVEVFYHPEDPGEALVLPGATGADVLSPMYPGLFTLLALMGWRLVAFGRRDPHDIPEVEREGRTHLTVFALPPTLVGLLGAGAGMLVGSLLWFSEADLSIPMALGIWAAVAALGMGAAQVQRFRLRSGTFDIILDEQALQLSLPATHGRKKRLAVPLNQIVAISLDRRGQQKKAYRPMLEYVDPRGGARREPIGPWLTDQDRAQALADALQLRLRCPSTSTTRTCRATSTRTSAWPRR